MFLIKLGNHARRRREPQARSPFARVDDRKSEWRILPRVIQIEMKSVAGQKSVVCLPKKFCVACLSDAQVFLGFLVVRIEPQGFAKLNHRL